jgi:RES domain-containing protein
MRVWRISKAKYAHSAFSGEGARLFDARWNFAGTPMVYTSSSLALAAIEYFVHLDPSEAPMGMVSLMAECRTTWQANEWRSLSCLMAGEERIISFFSSSARNGSNRKDQWR